MRVVNTGNALLFLLLSHVVAAAAAAVVVLHCIPMNHANQPDTTCETNGNKIGGILLLQKLLYTFCFCCRFVCFIFLVIAKCTCAVLLLLFVVATVVAAAAVLHEFIVAAAAAWLVS